MEQDTEPSEYHLHHQTPPANSSLISPPETTRLSVFTGLGYWLTVGIAVVSAIVASLDAVPVQWMERQMQTLFWQVRPKPAAPASIVILAIDDLSLNQGKAYSSNPEELPHLEPLKTFPWRRAAYATVIERLMQSRARVVALDVVFAEPSAYGAEDDAQLQRVLQTYGDRIVLAATYEDSGIRFGETLRLVTPLPLLEQALPAIGSINYSIEADGRIHHMPQEFPQRWAKQNPDLAPSFLADTATIPSFEQATVDSAKLPYPQPRGSYIFFYGSTGTFEHISFVDVLDPNAWSTYLQHGDFFRDKIVLIGATAVLAQDFHATPLALKMPGVEIHANSIATLLEGRALADAFPHPYQRGLVVFVEVAILGFILHRQRRWKACLGISLGLGVLIGMGGFLSMAIGSHLLPTAVPMLSIFVLGCLYSLDNASQDSQRQRQLRQTIKHYASAPIVREMITQHDDLRDLLQEKEQDILDSQLRQRYQVTRRLSGGGFGATYLAKDMQRPNCPYCVIKQLRPASDNPQMWEIARRLFLREAEALELLGQHDRIPQLLAHFEEDGEFYLVQEWIDGHPLSYELQWIIPKPEVKALCVIFDLLQTLEIVHQHGVIHRDIKPENIIRRHSDGRLVLIDFGAVKEIRRSPLESNDTTSDLTIGIGTRGYTPSEQAIGRPNYSSDIYAIGMIGVQLITGLHPRYLKVDPATGNTIWQTKVSIDPKFAEILDRMVRYNFRERYQTVTEVLADITPLVTALPAEMLQNPEITIGIAGLMTDPTENMGSTLPWSGSSIN
jgi:CHASE2 domain-containing sensor protein